MRQSRVELFDLSSECVPEEVPCAVLLPPGYEEGGPFPLCLVLHGGGASRRQLVHMQPLVDSWWHAGALAPMVLAIASTGEFSYYFDDPAGGPLWESFVAEDFLAHLRTSYRVRADRAGTLMTGVSMGGLGSLKIAFRRPDRFAAVAALQPTVEPALRAADVGARNRLHHLSGGPAALLGPERDAALFEANNPANLARKNAAAIRDSGLAIYLEVGDQDSIHLHDGAEFLHRVLWDLDISHEYHLVQGADHVGLSLAPRLSQAFRWLSSVFGAREAPVEEDAAVNALRAQLAPVRKEAAQEDPSTLRRYGVLPSVDP